MFYREFFDLVEKWIIKRQVFESALQKGFEYRAIDKESFRYLLEIKNSGIEFKNLPQQVVQLQPNQQMALCKDDDFSDYLFMKKQIRAP